MKKKYYYICVCYLCLLLLCIGLASCAGTDGPTASTEETEPSRTVTTRNRVSTSEFPVFTDPATTGNPEAPKTPILEKYPQIGNEFCVPVTEAESAGPLTVCTDSSFGGALVPAGDRSIPPLSVPEHIATEQTTEPTPTPTPTPTPGNPEWVIPEQRAESGSSLFVGTDTTGYGDLILLP